MSHVISTNQRLATEKSYIKFHELSIDVEGIESTGYNVGFGQTLYAIASDIHSFRCISSKAMLPVLPGCGIGVAFVRRGESCETYVSGPTNELRKIAMNEGDLVVIYRLASGAGRSLLKCPISEIGYGAVKAKGILTGEEQFGRLFRREIDLDEKVKNIASAIRTYIKQDPKNEIVSYCIDRLCQSDGNVKIGDLSEETNVTTRYMGKLFEREIGMSPKCFAEMLKVNKAASRIISSRDEKLTDIAVECGYYDHTHMNKMLNKVFHLSSGKIRNGMQEAIDYSRVDDYIAAE